MTNNAGMQVKFWGVRGSYPVPGEGTLKFGGNTPCVEVAAAGQTIIVDAGTGIIGLGRALSARARETGESVQATLLFSHLHNDHIQGFPFFGPAYAPGTWLDIVGPGWEDKTAELALTRSQTAPTFPVTLQEMPSDKVFHHLYGGETILLGESAGGIAVYPAGRVETPPDDVVVIRTHRSYAHPGGVLAYRIEAGGHSLVYASDVEGYVGTDRRLAAFAAGADVLIHDAMFTEEHYLGERPGAMCTQGHGHSTPQMACEVAALAGVKQLVLFHFDPGYDDETICAMQSRAQELFPAAAAAYEGLKIVLGESAGEEGTPASMALCGAGGA